MDARNVMAQGLILGFSLNKIDISQMAAIVTCDYLIKHMQDNGFQIVEIKNEHKRNADVR